MQQQLVLLIILLNCLLIKTQKLAYSYDKVNLVFYYSTGKFLESVRIPITTHLVLRNSANNAYILMGIPIDDKTLNIKRINCINFSCSCGSCKKNFESTYLSLQHLIPTEYFILKIEDKNLHLKQIFLNLSSQVLNGDNEFNLTCVVLDDYSYSYSKPKEPYGYPLSKTSLLGIIFLSVCAVLVFGLCIIWIAVIYYRRFTQYRMKKKLRKALAKSTQQILDKSPIIIFDSKNKNTDFTDDEPMCAICLESFKNEEKIRKLICSHYFHIICIDPWLLSHQSCPLCNRNILHDSIPTISSSIMAAVNEQNNDETTSIVNNDNNQIIQAQNLNL